MNLPWLFFFVSVFGLVFTLNALRPLYSMAGPSVLSFFAGWLTGELAVHHLVWQGCMAAVFIYAGALAQWPGQAGLMLCVASWVGLMICHHRAHASEGVLAAALETGLGVDWSGDMHEQWSAPGPEALPWRRRAMPFPVRHDDVERVADVVFHEEGRLRLRLDVFRKRASPKHEAPILIYVHGGAWVIGQKESQGLPMLHHLAASGWVCFNVDYRLSPRATWPDHVVDVKRAIAWVRAHATEYGGDPRFIVIAGASAGGHLASLAALSPNDPEFQPGFEGADTRVQGCISMYGIYDLTDRFGHWPHNGLTGLLERHVVKQSRAMAPDVYRRASPIDRVRPDAPPFLIVHGSHDTLVPVAEARCFEAQLRAVSSSAVVYAELPGAQHAFDIFPSRRTLHWLETVARFANWCHSRYLDNTGNSSVNLRGI